MKYFVLLKKLNRWEWIAVLTARLAVGILFFESGRGKLFYKLDELVAYFTQLGIPWPQFQAPMVATIEFVGGICLILGLATRLVSIPLAFTMVVATLTAHIEKVKTIGDLLYLPEVLLIVIFIWLIFAGPQKFAVDHYLEGKFAREERTR